jgi:hypothetical protein
MGRACRAQLKREENRETWRAAFSRLCSYFVLIGDRSSIIDRSNRPKVVRLASKRHQ